MKEQEFDIFVREALQDAQEPVSPRVWKGVSAGLRQNRRVFPLWAWYSLSGVAAAAAVVAVFVFLKPVPQFQEHSNPIISEAQIAQAAPPDQAETVLPIQEQLSAPAAGRLAKARPVTPVQAPNETVEAIASDPLLPVQLQCAQHSPIHAIQANVLSRPVVDDNALLAQLAYAETSRPSERAFSALLSGSLQGNQGNPVHGTQARPYGVPFKNMLKEGVTESPETRFGMPFSAGVGVVYNITSQLAVGTGVRYTNLSRVFPGMFSGYGIRTEEPTDIVNTQHWLGIPLNVYFNVVNLGRWRVYLMAGGEGEKLLDNHFLIHYNPNDINYHQEVTSPIQWSANAGLGVELSITPWMGLYLDPSIRYYFRTDQQPRSLRNIQPLRFDMEAGLRFSFGK